MRISDNQKAAISALSVLTIAMTFVFFLLQPAKAEVMATPLSFAKGIAERALETTKDVSRHASASIKKLIGTGADPKAISLRAADQDEAIKGISALVGPEKNDRLARYLRNGLMTGSLKFAALDILAQDEGTYFFIYANWHTKNDMQTGERKTIVFPLSARDEPLIIKSSGKGILFSKDKSVSFDGDETLAVSKEVEG